MPITTKPSVFYGHQYITRKVMTAFMDWLGQNLFIERLDSTGAVYRYIQVPVQWATRERFLTVIQAVNQKTGYGGDQTIKIDFNRILPRIAVTIINFTYDADRHVSKFQKTRQITTDSGGTLGTIPAPVPYILEVEVSAITKMTDDTFQIMEQLLPYFGPTYNLDVNFLSGYESKSVGFTMTSIIPESSEELGIDEERVYIMTYNFSIKLDYPFIKTDREVIKDIIASYHTGKGDTPVNLTDDSFDKFLKYQLTVDNLTPVTLIGDRENEPVTTTITLAPVVSIAISVESGKSSLSLTASDPTAQYTAIGTFSDGSTTDITDSGVWGSGTPATGTINSGSGGGLFTPLVVGTTNITFIHQGVQSNTLVQTVVA